MRVRTAVQITAMLAFSTSSMAMPLSQYQNLLKTSPEAVDTYLLGVGSGMMWSNVELEARNQPLLYCMPEKVPFNGRNYRDILESHLAKQSSAPSPATPIEMLLLNAMTGSFPCSRGET